MPSTLEIISAFSQRHPRVTGGLYQVFLCFIIFQCVVAIARYSPTPSSVPFKQSFTYSCETSSTGPAHCHITGTATRMCEFGAREKEVNVGPLAVCFLAPNFSSMILKLSLGIPPPLHSVPFNIHLHRIMPRFCLGYG